MSRRTDRHASVPLFTKRTISTLGTRSITACAIVFCRHAHEKVTYGPSPVRETHDKGRRVQDEVQYDELDCGARSITILDSAMLSCSHEAVSL